MKVSCLKLGEGVIKLDLFKQCCIEIKLVLLLGFMEHHYGWILLNLLWIINNEGLLYMLRLIYCFVLLNELNQDLG